MGLKSKSVGLLWGFYKVIRLAHGLPWKKIREEEIGFNFLFNTIFLSRGLCLNSHAGKGKDYHAGFRRSFFGNN